MKRITRRVLVISILGVASSAGLFWPGLPWSARFRHSLKRFLVKTEMRVSAWQGEPARLVSLRGRLVTEDPRRKVLAGAHIEALDSISGWASLTDERGEFVLRDLLWYPGVRYKLVIAPNDYDTRQLEVIAPARCPEDRNIELGELGFDCGCRIDGASLPGRNSISILDYDRGNAEYYRRLFDDLAEGGETDEARLGAIDRYVAARLLPEPLADNEEAAKCVNTETPRCVLENGTRHCGKLALAFATLAEAGDYKTRLIDLIDSGPTPASHVVVEVYYGDRWHMYDPILGSTTRRNGVVVSYKQQRLDPGDLPSQLPTHLPEIEATRHSLPGILGSGLHHYYYIDRKRSSSVQ